MLEALSVVNAPVEALDAPMVVPLIDPPEIVTLLAFWLEIVPSVGRPVRSEYLPDVATVASPLTLAAGTVPVLIVPRVVMLVLPAQVLRAVFSTLPRPIAVFAELAE